MGEETMKVRLTGRWGSRLPGSIISVSEARALYLQNELKIGKIIDPMPERPTVAQAKAKEVDRAKAKKGE
jgi:hypothetical protein